MQQHTLVRYRRGEQAEADGKEGEFRVAESAQRQPIDGFNGNRRPQYQYNESRPLIALGVWSRDEV